MADATYKGDRFLAMVGIGYGVVAGIVGALFAGVATKERFHIPR